MQVLKGSAPAQIRAGAEPADGQAKPSELSDIRPAGIALLLGAKRNYTALSWDLESVVPFLRAERDLVPAGGKHSVEGEPGTLDEHLKVFIKRDVARWLARVLAEAGVIEVSRRPALSVRLADGFARPAQST